MCPMLPSLHFESLPKRPWIQWVIHAVSFIVSRASQWDGTNSSLADSAPAALIACFFAKKMENDWGSLPFMFLFMCLFYILVKSKIDHLRRMACFLLAQDWKGAWFACHDGKIWKDVEKVVVFFYVKAISPFSQVFSGATWCFLRCHMVPHGATETHSAPERHVQVWPSLFASIP